MSKKSFICLHCGRKCFIEQEDYEMIRNNPICDGCRQRNGEEVEQLDVDREDAFVSDVIRMIGRGINRVVIGRKHHEVDVPMLNDAPLNPKTAREGSFSQGAFWGSGLSKTARQEGEKISRTPTPRWEPIGCLGDIYDHHKEVLSRYNNCVGLYMHKINGQIMYIGRAVEYNNGGFRKRLSDYCRDNDSARKHPSGQKIYANRYRIQTYLMVVGSDQLAAEESKLLEKQFVAKYNPPWNDKLKGK